MQQQIKHYAELVREGSGDPYAGRTLFRSTCGACHKLFAEGGQIGPDLTPFKRDDPETTLLNVVNPNAEIREGYENFQLTTKDGRPSPGFSPIRMLASWFCEDWMARASSFLNPRSRK